MDKVSVVGLSGVQKKSRLLSAVRDQIAVDPAKAASRTMFASIPTSICVLRHRFFPLF